MADDRPIERLRFTPRSLVLAVALLGATLAGLRLLASATRVVGWVLAASVIAGLLFPVVARLSRWVPRAVAILVVVLVTLSAVGIVAYGLIDELVRETHALQAAAPDVGRDLERSKRFGEVARRLNLSERIARFADQVPNRLRGGDPAQALRSAVTRGLAFLVTGILSLFLLLHGPKLVAGGLRQIRDPVRRDRVAVIAEVAYHRAWRYVAGSVAKAIFAGLLGFVLARSFGVPGAAPLAVWVALWDVVPLVGAVIGATPIAVVAATLGSLERGIVMAAIMLAYAVFEVFVIQRRIERRSLRLGPFVTIVAGLVGLEVYGAGGALLLVVFCALAAAVLSEMTPEEAEASHREGPPPSDGQAGRQGLPR